MFSEQETTINVAFGYLSVLLSYTCLNSAARQLVSSRLRGGSLFQLLEAVREFLQYYTRIDKEIYEDDGRVDLAASFTGRLQKLVEKLESLQE